MHEHSLARLLNVDATMRDKTGMSALASALDDELSPRSDCATSERSTTETLGLAYLATLEPNQRQAVGQVYTPQHIVDFVLDLAKYTPSAPIERMPLLDPSCGAGAFLSNAISRLADRLRKIGMDLSSPLGRSYFIGFVQSVIYGVDIDPEACRLAMRSLQSTVSRLVHTTVPSNFLAQNIIVADFLLDPRVDCLAGAYEGGFAHIVGNPPYVQATRLTSEYKDLLRARYETARGRIDLYTMFMEKSLSLLRHKGRMSFITPDKFLSSHSSRTLRSHLQQRGTLVSVATFQSHKVFQDAATVPCVTVFELGGSCPHIEVIRCTETSTTKGSVNITGRSRVPRSRLSQHVWQVSSPSLLRIATRLQSEHVPLKSCVNQISAGYATGRDSIFLVPKGAAAEVEDVLRHPAVRGRDVFPGRIAPTGVDIILPYVFPKAGGAHLVDINEFPGLREYLKNFKSELNKRHCVRVWKKAWYDVHDPVTCDLTRRPKILVPDVACNNRFAFDPGRYCPLHSSYYIIPTQVEPRYLAAVLNTSPIEFIVRLLAPVVKDGYSRYRKQFLMDLPVPTAKPKSLLPWRIR